MEMAFEDLLAMLDEKIKFGENLITQLQSVQHLDGVMKLQRKIRQEIEFLKKLQKSKKVKTEQLSCSNLRHLGAMVECAMRPGVVAVCKIFHIDDNSKLVIDIISEQGKTWTKVIARNPKSLTALSTGNASYGARSILDQANDYLECAKLYPCMYQAPKVVFEFMSGIEENLANKLKAVGVIVKGNVLPDSRPIIGEDCDDSWDSECSDEEIECNRQETILQDVSQCIEEHPELTTLNLDVTAMMAYVSNMTNGHCKYVFKQDVLTQQAAWEAERPVKPVLDKLFQGKVLICCTTAWDDFEKIVNTLGGPMEKKRTAQLKDVVKVFPDDFGGEDDYPRKNLKVRGHVRLRSKTVFNFGHRSKALTVSANEGFVRAAWQQGVTYAAYIHESRALTEGKEATATRIL
ncbi:UPF0415 protein C7orf25 homolog [Galleria mellonella]|uniref:UPF0415 protein C7orf25 homolog n=1 Tax=Galleria mellonella TaxID=7137 RepID=A0A6J3C193_GALME|nr:UPF0415 protein C7orf25 homolog [Galleria mellonella]XP_031766076.2 UPF0415 protein C7orf25 homolog [Galleria mellonella]XP_031766088.2 UPF0415 protein C7orf25 homolog [Galleria mellonella]